MKQSYIFLCILVVLSGCITSGNQQGKTLNDCPQVATLYTENGEHLIVADLHLFKQDVKTIPLSELIEDFEIIKLDSHPEALVEEGLTFVTKNYIGFGKIEYPQRMPYKLFDRKGNFLSTIGSIGQGPGEYANMYGAYIDEKNNRIYILPWSAGSLLAYDLEGNVCDPIPLAYPVPKGTFQVDGDKQKVYVGVLPFQESGIDAVYWEQDFEGNIIHQIAAGHFSVYPDFSNEVSSYRNTEEKDFYIFYWATRQDSLYHYDEVKKRLKPVFTVNFKENLVMHDYGELPGHFLANVTTDFKTTTDGRTTMTQAEKPAYELIIDKQTLKGTYYELVNDYLGNMPIEYPMYYFKNGYFIMNMDPGNLHEQLENHLSNSSKLTNENRENLTKLYKSISIENDNNYLLIGKLKSENHPVGFLTEGKKEETNNLSTPLPNKEVTIQADELVHDEDTTIYDMPFNTAYLTTWKTYFPANNRFKDWPKEDEKMIMVRSVVEKSGKATQVRVTKSSDNPELDAEAIRLIQEAPIEPAIDEEGNKVRSHFFIPVYFPPR